MGPEQVWISQRSAVGSLGNSEKSMFDILEIFFEKFFLLQ